MSSDGGKADHERGEVRRIAERLGQGTPLDVGAICQDVLTTRPGLSAIARSLLSDRRAGLQQTFQSMLGDAKQLQGRYAGQITERARTLDFNKLLSAVKS